MARPSARPQMINAALAVVKEHGITALTLDAVADQAGVTKRGLLYHFPTKHALITGIHQELAARTERELLDATGKGHDEASLAERTRGYVRATLRAPTNVDFRLMLEAANEEDWIAPWVRLYGRWFPEDHAPGEDLDDASMRCLIARMAADGSWAYGSTPGSPLNPGVREQLAERILATLQDL